MIHINPRETVIDEFWDPALSVLGQYSVASRSGRGFRAEQFWCRVECAWDGGEPGVIGDLSRPVDIDLSEFSEIVVAASLPTDVALAVTLSNSSGKHRIELGYGSSDIDEHRGDIRSIESARSLSFEFSTTSSDRGLLSLLWVGFARELPSNRYADTPVCTTTDKYFRKYIRPVTEIKEVQPTREFLFTKADIERIREGARDPLRAPLAEHQRRAAAQFMKVDPGECLGRYVWLSGRAPDFARVRDRNVVDLRKACQTLAFVSLVDNRPDMAVKACEFALILASCSVWRESFVAEYPFSSWAHAAFTEALCTEAVALTVDWAGKALNPAGERFLAESVYDKALWRIERQFMRRYYRVTNPEPVFFPALIMGGLLVSECFVYYTPRIREHFRLFTRVFGATILNDDGTNRPPLYWNKLLAPSLVTYRICEAYSRNAAERYVDFIIRSVHQLIGGRSVPLETLARKTAEKYGSVLIKTALFPGRRRILKKSDNFARAFDALLSNAVNYPELLPIGDRTTSSVLPDAVLLLSTSKTAKNTSYWRSIAQTYIRNHGELLGKSALASALALSMSSHDTETPATPYGRLGEDRLVHLKHSGFFSARRRLDGMDTLFVMLGLPKESEHRHSDVGSVLLQVNGQDVLLDRGSAKYGSPLASQLRAAQYHNVLTPCDDRNARLWPSHQYAPRVGVQLRGKSRGRGFVCKGEFGELWPEYLITHRRQVESERPELLALRDRVHCLIPCRVTLHFHSPLDCSISGNQTVLTGVGFEVRITAESGIENLESFVDLVDERGREINHICLTTPRQSEHDLNLAVTTAPAD